MGEIDRATAARVLARISEGEMLRVLVGDGKTESASEIVLTAPAADVLRSILTRGLVREIKEADEKGVAGAAGD